MIACPNCGGPLDIGDRFCGNCGAGTTPPSAPVAPRSSSSCSFALVAFVGLSASFLLLVVVVAGYLALSLDVLPRKTPTADTPPQAAPEIVTQSQPILERLLDEFERQHAFQLDPDGIGHQRMQEQAQAAAISIAYGEPYRVNLPFIAVDSENNPIHFVYVIEP